MNEINVLDKQTAELIAAGEVVDRPASVVKELVENAIDAGADIITVEIKNGGISYIRITDNGIGIDKSQVKKAFLRHATSKIKIKTDLDKILTLGFRGEALASIAAMCKVEIMTKTYESIEGVRFVIEGGEEKSRESVGCPMGTTMIVRDIFYNTPARMKFLKRDVTEGNAISTIVEKMAISHPEVGIKFIRDGKIKLQTPGDNNPLSAINAVYGREFAKSLVSVESNSGGFGISGFISKPEKCKNSRRFQNFFINSRYVKSVTAMAALEEAYKNSLMVGKFPACVINISVPTDSVDVNVHPAKIEVRFSNEKKVFDCVYYGVKNAIINYDSIENNVSSLPNKKVNDISPFTLKQNENAEQQKFVSGVSVKEFKSIADRKVPYGSKDNKTVSNTFVYGKKNEEYVPKDIDTASFVEYNKSTKMPPISSFSGGDSLRYFVNGKNIYKDKSVKNFDGETCLEDTADKDEVIVHHMHDEVMKSFEGYKEIPKNFSERDVTNIKKAASEKNRLSKGKFKDARLIGELFATYIVLEMPDKLVLVDKHAAHERLIFEKLRGELNNKGINRQTLLCPISVKLDAELHQCVCENKEKIANLGFYIDDFGDKTVIIREIPMFVSSSDAESVFCELAESFLKNKNDLTPQAYDDLLHSMSCKAAIKANDKNSATELAEIVRLLDNNSEVKYCPHGRPIYINMTKREIEKLFGRTK